MDALRGAWLREVSRVSPEGSGASSFELLVESSKDVPGWLDAVRRSGLSRDPALGMLLVAVAFWGIGLLPGAIFAALSGDFVLAAVLGLAGFGLTAGFVVAYRRVRERWERERADEMGAWRRRLDDLRSRMDRFLGDL